MAGSSVTYTLEEASALVPSVRAVLLQLAVEKHRFDEEIDRLRTLATAGEIEPAPASVDRQETVIRELGEGIQALADHLRRLGVELRDMEMGLVDIPTERDGDRVWFCWRLADPEIAFWHTTREGFTQRRPL